MIVDCGGGTVDLTTFKLTDDIQLDEITERASDFCGSTFIDAEFIKYLRKRIGDEPIDLLKENNYQLIKMNAIKWLETYNTIIFLTNEGEIADDGVRCTDLKFQRGVQETFKKNIDVISKYIKLNLIKLTTEEVFSSDFSLDRVLGI